jgi:hypothetical protein
MSCTDAPVASDQSPLAQLYSRTRVIDDAIFPVSEAAVAHRCCLFRTEELVYQKRWEGADGCHIVLQPFARHAQSAHTAVDMFKTNLLECGIASTVSSPTPRELIVSQAEIVVVQDPRPMYALLPWCLLCLPAKSCSAVESPAHAETALVLEIEALLADQRSLLESMQRAKAFALQENDSLDSKPTEAALRCLNNARLQIEMQLSRFRSMGKRAQAKIRVESCSLCQRVLRISEPVVDVDEVGQLSQKIATLQVSIDALNGPDDKIVRTWFRILIFSFRTVTVIC